MEPASAGGSDVRQVKIAIKSGVIAMLALLAWVAVAPWAGAQTADAHLSSVEKLDSPWRIHSLMEDAGLTRRNAFSFAFERNGNIWVAASDGVYFSDGYQWKRYTSAEGLPSNFTRSVYVTGAGAVWVGTANGVAVFNGTNFVTVGQITDLAGPSVRRIMEDPDGTMWFCSDRWPDSRAVGGLTSYKDGVWRRYGASDGLPSDHVLNYFRTGNGTQFVLTTGGAARRDGARWIPLGAPGIPKGERAWQMVQSPKWGLFLQTETFFLRWTGSVWEQNPRPRSPLCVTKSGDIIAYGHSESGPSFQIWDGKSFKPVASFGSTYNHPEYVGEAPDGSIWVGGVNNLRRWERAQSEWTEFQSLPQPRLHDTKGRFWFPGDVAAMSFDGTKSEWHEGLTHNVSEGAAGTIWTWSPGGDITEGASEPRRHTPADTGLATITSFHAGADGRVVVHGRDSVSRPALAQLTNGVWTTRLLPELAGKQILSSQFDSEGGLWSLVGPAPHELMHHDDMTERFAVNSELSIHGNPQLMVADEGVWLFGNFGLYRLIDGGWKEIQEVRHNVFGAVKATNAVCFLYDGNAGGGSGYIFYADGRYTRHRAELSEFSAVLSDGAICLTESDGLLIVDPVSQQIIRRLTLPRETQVFTVVGAADRELWMSVDGGAVLRYRPDGISPASIINDSTEQVPTGGLLRLQMTGVQRFMPRSSRGAYQYSWRYNNKEWSDFGALPSSGLSVGDIGAGNHTLEVRARDEGLDVQAVPARAMFTVLPVPLQHRSWFWPTRLLFSMIVLVLAALAWRRAEAFKAANISLTREIESREQAQRDLLAERRLLDALMNSVPDKIFFKDTQSRFTRVNQAMADLFKLSSPSALVGRTDFDLFPEPEAKAAFADEQQIIRSGHGLIGKTEHFEFHGEPIWVSATKMPLRNAAGKTIGIVGISRDITETKNAELELERQRAEYQTIFDSVPALVIYKDPHNRILRVNRFTTTFWERTEAEIKGLQIADLDPAHGAAYDAMDARVISSGESMLGSLEEVQVRSGESRWVRTDRLPYRDVDGAVIGVIIFSVDITERRRATEAVRRAKEELEARVLERTAELSHANAVLEHEVTERAKMESELRRTEAFLKSVLENLPISVFIKDAAELRFVLMNKANQELTGCPEDEILGKSDKDFFPAEQADLFTRIDREVLRTGQLRTSEEFLDTPHRGRRTLLTNKIPVFDSAGRPQYLVGISEDITERRRAELELKQAKEAAESANTAKSEFLANMSHEIRTPMNAIIGMTNLLLDTGLSAEQRDFTETVRGSGEALLMIINDILDFSKIESGTLAFEQIDFDLQEVVETAVDLLAERARAKNIELACLVEANVLTRVKGDPGRLRQVLTNLISNAVKFTEVGEVFVLVSVESDEPGMQKIRFQVKDTGIGIAPELQGKLFQPFSQADTSTTRKYGGTGLGLVISKKLANLMGGDIGLESSPIAGSTFWFALPFEKQDAHASKATPEELQGLRVLVVDDNATNRLVMRHQLSSWRMTHGLAESGASALDELRRAASVGAAYQLAILDMQMPGMDGVTLARAIKMDPALATTRTILLTSLGERLAPAAMSEVGLCASLLKPIRQSDLYNCLATVAVGSTVPTRHSAAPAATAPSAASSLRVLLVEDNLVNQKVGLQQLRKLGHAPEVASNGCEALKKWEGNGYDIIFMDCQMPEMDGYEATRNIRLREAQQRAGGGVSAHVHIVALTANAMKGDREKCIEAGMDDYISKPVSLADLETVLTRLCRTTNFDAQKRFPLVAQATTSTPLNELTLAGLRELGMVGGLNPLAELAPLFIEDSAVLLKQIREAIRSQDSARLKHLAHALKGSSRNIGADRLGRLCETIERQGTVNAWEAAEALAQQAAAELKAVHAALRAEVGP